MSAEQSWEEWALTNLANGCNQNEIRCILLENDFSDGETQSMLTNAGGKILTIANDTQPSRKINSTSAGLTNQIHLHHAVAIENDKIELYAIENFINDDECAQIIALIREKNRPSTTTEEGVSEFRTSLTCDLAKLNHPLIEDIDRRMCQCMGITPEESEQIQGQLYEVGQQFKAHTDYFHNTSDNFIEYISDQGQRSWTFMVYLNTTREGGATEFPVIDIAIEPTAGTALIWNNRLSDGSCNPDTLHCGSPVVKGYKAILTKWFRTPGAAHVFIKEKNERLPSLTRNGFLLTDAPANIYQAVHKYYQSNRKRTSAEQDPQFIHGDYSESPGRIVELSDELREKIQNNLQPFVENWVGDYVDPSFVYGIHEFKKSAVIKMHRDQLHTHSVSAMINIDQTPNCEWPLVIEDHFYRQHKVRLKPGQMLVYESAKLLHGRPVPFSGDNYANVVVHFKLRSHDAVATTEIGV